MLNETINTITDTISTGINPDIPLLPFSSDCYTASFVNEFVAENVVALRNLNWGLSLAAIGLVIIAFCAEYVRKKQIKALKQKIAVLDGEKKELQKVFGGGSN